MHQICYFLPVCLKTITFAKKNPLVNLVANSLSFASTSRVITQELCLFPTLVTVPASGAVVFAHFRVCCWHMLEQTISKHCKKPVFGRQAEVGRISRVPTGKLRNWTAAAAVGEKVNVLCGMPVLVDKVLVVRN